MAAVSRVVERSSKQGTDGVVPIPQRIADFAQHNGMNVIQLNAQRLYGPPYYVYPNWEPEYGSEIFIGRLPRSFHEPELMPYLAQTGPVFQLRLMMDFSGKTNKGFGFVRYFTAHQADLALTYLNDLELKQNHKIFAMKSVDNRRLMLSGLPTYRSYKEIMDRIMSISEGVAFVASMWTAPATHPRGIAVVTYVSHRAAALARKRMIGKAVYFWEYQISVDWAEPDTSLNGVGPYFSNRPQVVCVRNYPEDMRVTAMRQMFNEHSFGGVKRLRISGSQMFIFFRSHVQGEAAKMALNGALLGNKVLQIQWIDPQKVPLTRRQKLRKKKHQDQLTQQQAQQQEQEEEEQPCEVAGPSNSMATIIYQNLA